MVHRRLGQTNRSIWNDCKGVKVLVVATVEMKPVQKPSLPKLFDTSRKSLSNIHHFILYYPKCVFQNILNFLSTQAPTKSACPHWVEWNHTGLAKCEMKKCLHKPCLRSEGGICSYQSSLQKMHPEIIRYYVQHAEKHTKTNDNIYTFTIHTQYSVNLFRYITLWAFGYEFSSSSITVK